jgi:hypothetical protein
MHLRFTIRDLLWLTLVVAMAVGWWVDHRAISTGLAEILWQRWDWLIRRNELEGKLRTLRERSPPTKSEPQDNPFESDAASKSVPI